MVRAGFFDEQWGLVDARGRPREKLDQRLAPFFRATRPVRRRSGQPPLAAQVPGRQPGPRRRRLGPSAAGRSSGPGTGSWAPGRAPDREAQDRVPGGGAAGGPHAAPRPARGRPRPHDRRAYLLVPDGEGRSRPCWSSSTSRRRPSAGASRGGSTSPPAGQAGLRHPVAGQRPRRDRTRTRSTPELQPLSYLAYVAANGYNALANLPEVDPERVGVMGHSYGGKWALFASCLYDKFACGVWSDPGRRLRRGPAERQLLGALVSGLGARPDAQAGRHHGREPPHRGLQAAGRGGPRPARAARPDGPAAVPRLRRLGGPARAVAGAEPRRRGQPAPGLRGPGGDDQPPRPRPDRGVERADLPVPGARPETRKGGTGGRDRRAAR